MKQPERLLNGRKHVRNGGFDQISHYLRGAITLTLDEGVIGVVGEAVQQGGDDGRVGEDGIPVFEGPV